MISSGRLSDKKQHLVKTYCFWIGEGDLYVDKKTASDKYRKENIICRNCKGCQ